MSFFPGPFVFPPLLLGGPVLRSLAHRVRSWFLKRTIFWFYRSSSQTLHMPLSITASVLLCLFIPVVCRIFPVSQNYFFPTWLVHNAAMLMMPTFGFVNDAAIVGRYVTHALTLVWTSH